MKKRYFILVLIFSQMITACKNEVVNELDKSNVHENNLVEDKVNSLFENLFLEFNSSLVYEAMLCVGKEEKLKLAEEIAWGDLLHKLNNSLDKTALMDQITELYDKNNNVLYRVENYCHLAITLKMPLIYDTEEPFYLAELLYELKQTKEFVTSFFNHPGQSWESLATSQSSELYHKTLLYLSSLQPEEQVDYIINYYNLCKQKMISD